MDVLIGFGGVVLGFVLSAVWSLWRDKTRTNGERRSVAAALSAELTVLREHGMALLGDAVRPDGRVSVEPGTTFEWSAEESYFSVYDSLAGRIGLLPRELLCQVVTVYVHAKAAVDTLRLACRLTADREHWDSVAVLTRAAQVILSAATEVAALTPKLDAVARTK